MSTTETDAPAEVLTIDEAATILRISRNAAYAAAREWRATGGKVGIPCIEIGRTLRVPRTEFERLLAAPREQPASLASGQDMSAELYRKR